jgi:hypothetical protein
MAAPQAGVLGYPTKLQEFELCLASPSTWMTIPSHI